MKAEIKLSKDALVEAVRAYVVAEIPKAHVTEVNFTGSYGNTEVTVSIGPEIAKEAASIYIDREVEEGEGL